MVSNRDETQAGTGKEQLVDPEERKTTPGGHGGSPNGTSGQGALEPIYPTHEGSRTDIFRRRSGFEYDPNARSVGKNHRPHHSFEGQISRGHSLDAPQRPPLIPAAGSSESYACRATPTPYYAAYPNRVGPSYPYGNSAALPPPSQYPMLDGSFPPVPYPYYPPPHIGYPRYHWTPVLPVECIADIKPSDVLSGRGGATNSHSGNRAFRSLVKKYQGEYLKAKKRDKPAVAAIIVQTIRDKGGRFLKRVDTNAEGQVLWVDIGDDRAKEKTCQALRENAPELRRKRKNTESTDEEDTGKISNDDAGELSPNSSCGQTASNDEGSGSFTNRTLIIRNTEAPAHLFHQQQDSSPIMIRPSQMLIRRRIPEAISIDQLEPQERELYLRDFLPPDPCIRKKATDGYSLNAHSSFHETTQSESENSSAWSLVKV